MRIFALSALALLASAGCAIDNPTESDEPTRAVAELAQPPDLGCWEYGRVTTLKEGACGYSSASADLGLRTTSGYWSSVHPHTCYMQVRNAPDLYDGGCDDAAQRGKGTQFLMNYTCDGVEHSSGWLDSDLYDGWCGLDHVITACSIRSRAPGC
jgi:hypothetical protein